MRKRITFVNTFEPPFGLYEAVFPELDRMGWSATALMSSGSYRKESDLKYARKLVWLPECLRSRKQLCHLSYYGAAPLVVRRDTSDAFVFISAPPLFFSLAPWLCRQQSTPYIVHVMDVYPDLFARSGMITETGAVYRRLWSMALRSFEAARGVVVLGRCMAQILEGRGVDPDRLYIVNNWTQANVSIDEIQPNPFRIAHGLEDRFVILYAGNLGSAHEFRTLMRAARDLEVRPDITFVIIGQGTRHKEIVRAVASGARNVLLLGYQPRHLLPHVMAAGDVHFVSLRSGYEGLMVPSKFYSSLSAGRPVLYEGAHSGEVALEIGEYGCGRVIRPGDVEALVHSILEYADDTELREAAAAAARKAHSDRHDPATGAANYARLLASLSDNHQECIQPLPGR